MLAQHALLPMLDQGVEDAVPRKQLTRVLLDPEPGTHLQRQRQKHALRMCFRLQVQVVPQVTVRQVLQALRLDDVAMMVVRLDKNSFQRVHLGQMGDR